MKHFTVFVLLFSMACEPEHDGYDGPVFLEAPDVSDPDANIEVCDDVGGLCWTYPIHIDYSPSYDSYIWQLESFELENICESISMRIATTEEFREASKRCVFDYYAILTDEDFACEENCRITEQIECAGFTCDGSIEKTDFAKDTWNSVTYCTKEKIPSSHQYIRCVKPID